MRALMAGRTCAHCGGPIPHSKRAGTRFCKAACRVNHHIKTKPQPTLSDDVALSPIEAGLLIDASEPWLAFVAGREPSIGHPVWSFTMHGKTPTPEAMAAWRVWHEDQARAKRVQRAWRRLAALGLVRVGKALGLARTAIERTDAGTALLSKRHNELHAIAERGNGEPLSDLTVIARVALWRGGGDSVVLPN